MHLKSQSGILASTNSYPSANQIANPKAGTLANLKCRPFLMPFFAYIQIEEGKCVSMQCATPEAHTIFWVSLFLIFDQSSK